MSSDTINMKSLLAIIQCVLLLLACLALSSCLYRETEVSQERIQLVTTQVEQDYLTLEMSDQAVKEIADHHDHHGSSPLDVAVTYDPRSRTNTAMKASDEAARLSQAFTRARKPTQVRILPVSGHGETSHTLVHYKSVNAQPPEKCPAMFEGGERNTGDLTPGYGFGCTLETEVSKQIARPGDLAGRSDLEKDDGRRTHAIVRPYMSGESQAAE